MRGTNLIFIYASTDVTHEVKDSYKSYTCSGSPHVEIFPSGKSHLTASRGRQSFHDQAVSNPPPPGGGANARMPGKNALEVRLWDEP